MDALSFHYGSPEARESIAERLDDLLGNYSIYHENIRRINWDSKLRPFLDLNGKVELLYQVSQRSRDEIAEQIVDLGFTPTIEDPTPSYLPAKTEVKALQFIEGFDHAVLDIVQASRQLLEMAKDIFYLAQEYKEEETIALMSKVIQQLSFTAVVFSSVRLAQNN
ncbi:MAG: hypothetical protein AAF135_25385 [Bacteroidota bacterium]